MYTFVWLLAQEEAAVPKTIQGGLTVTVVVIFVLYGHGLGVISRVINDKYSFWL